MTLYHADSELVRLAKEIALESHDVGTRQIFEMNSSHITPDAARLSQRREYAWSQLMFDQRLRFLDLAQRELVRLAQPQ